MTHWIYPQVRVSDRFHRKITRLAKRTRRKAGEIFEVALEMAIADAPPPARSPIESTALVIAKPTRPRQPLPECTMLVSREDAGTVYLFGNLAIAVDHRGRLANIDFACRGA